MVSEGIRCSGDEVFMRVYEEKCHAMQERKKFLFSRRTEFGEKSVSERESRQSEGLDLGWLHCGYLDCGEVCVTQKSASSGSPSMEEERERASVVPPRGYITLVRWQAVPIILGHI